MSIRRSVLVVVVAILVGLMSPLSALAGSEPAPPAEGPDDCSLD